MEFKRLKVDSKTLIGFDLKIDLWEASAGKFSFIISKNEIGYSASYKDLEYEGAQSSNFLKNTGGTEIFRTLHQAETACRLKLRELRKH